MQALRDSKGEIICCIKEGTGYSTSPVGKRAGEYIYFFQLGFVLNVCLGRTFTTSTCKVLSHGFPQIPMHIQRGPSYTHAVITRFEI